MREFEIPDETWTAVDRADLWIPRSDLRAALAAAAPLILAAELERWASILEAEAQRLIDSIDKADAAGLGAAGAQAALSRQAREMRAEVAELAWTSMKDVERELGPLTEVPAVPPAEPGVGA